MATGRMVVAAGLALGLLVGCGGAVVTAADLGAGDGARVRTAIEQLAESGDLDAGLVGRLPGSDRDLVAPPLVWAVAGGAEAELIAELLAAGAAVDTPDERGATALIHAAAGREPAIVRLLFEAGADVDLRDEAHQGVFDAARENPGLRDDPVYAELHAAQTGSSRHAGEEQP